MQLLSFFCSRPHFGLPAQLQRAPKEDLVVTAAGNICVQYLFESALVLLGVCPEVGLLGYIG